MPEPTPKDAFLASLERCRSAPGFLSDFYDRFLASDPAIAHKFRFTDMRRQVKMLDDSLSACADAVDGSREGLAHLAEIAKSHDRFHHDVRPEWYALWLEALIETAAKADPDWSDEVEAVWRDLLSHVIHRMAEKYDG